MSDDRDEVIDALETHRTLLVRALRALRSEHLCATVQDDGSCGGCAVSAVLSDPLAVALLKEADRG